MNIMHTQQKEGLEMTPCHQCVQEWIEENRKEMIYCPSQPGSLKITKSACIKRYLAAKERPFEKISRNDPFYYALKCGMDRCISCPIGKRYADLIVSEEEEKSA